MPTLGRWWNIKKHGVKLVAFVIVIALIMGFLFPDMFVVSLRLFVMIPTTFFNFVMLVIFNTYYVPGISCYFLVFCRPTEPVMWVLMVALTVAVLYLIYRFLRRFISSCVHKLKTTDKPSKGDRF